jgi:hypothetical protein
MARRIRRARVLWIEADPVFGGSLSQVQFPVELSGFFGLPQNAVFGTTKEIAVSAAGVDFPRKKMDFHHNQMWRLNLPTARQGLGGYPQRILVFEKTNRQHRFRLSTLEPGQPLMRKLRSVSRARGRIGSTRREDGSPRTFGYF